MTNQNKDIESWEAEFDKRFGKVRRMKISYSADSKVATVYDATDYTKLKSWIKSNMVSKAEMREWIEATRVDTEEGALARFNGVEEWETHEDVLNMLEAKLNEN